MFSLITIEDSVSVHPSNFGVDFKRAIRDEIDKKFSNKILHKEGLCIFLHDILEARQPVVYPGEGSANIRLKFRMIMFRPYEGEILQGKINKSTPEGVGVTLDFFDDIFIPHEHFPQDTHYDEEESVWVWKYDEGVDLYFDIGEEIRFMVLSEEFRERVIEKGDYNVPDEEEETKPLYSVTGFINSSGLGCVKWWAAAEQAEDDVEMQT